MSRSVKFGVRLAVWVGCVSATAVGLAFMACGLTAAKGAVQEAAVASVSACWIVGAYVAARSVVALMSAVDQFMQSRDE